MRSKQKVVYTNRMSSALSLICYCSKDKARLSFRIDPIGYIKRKWQYLLGFSRLSIIELATIYKVELIGNFNIIVFRSAKNVFICKFIVWVINFS